MTYGTKPDIRLKIRKITGSGNSLQITDSVIDDYIDSFYFFDFPAQFRSLKLKDNYVFRTIQGQDTYPFDSENYTTVEMPCKVEKNPVQLFQDPGSFYGYWGYNNGASSQFAENFSTGNGTIGPYSGTATQIPMIASVNTSIITNPNKISIVPNILITANTGAGTLNVWDDGAGGLIGDVNDAFGTINYQNGIISSLNFNQSVPSGNSIQIQYIPVVLNIPKAILFFQNQFTLRPVPDKGYTVELVSYRRPSQAVTNVNNFYPELTEWWEVIAVGASKKIFEDRGDMAGVAFTDKTLKERYSMAETRTYAQLGKQRCGTIFANQIERYNNGGWGFGGSL